MKKGKTFIHRFSNISNKAAKQAALKDMSEANIPAYQMFKAERLLRELNFNLKHNII